MARTHIFAANNAEATLRANILNVFAAWANGEGAEFNPHIGFIRFNHHEKSYSFTYGEEPLVEISVTTDRSDISALPTILLERHVVRSVETLASRFPLALSDLMATHWTNRPSLK